MISIIKDIYYSNLSNQNYLDKFLWFDNATQKNCQFPFKIIDNNQIDNIDFYFVSLIISIYLYFTGF